MSSSEAEPGEQELDDVSRAIARTAELARRCAAQADDGVLSVRPADARELLAAAVCLYSALEDYGALDPITESDVTATEAVVGAAALMNAQHLNPFDLQLWISRTPDIG